MLVSERGDVHAMRRMQYEDLARRHISIGHDPSAGRLRWGRSDAITERCAQPRRDLVAARQVSGERRQDADAGRQDEVHNSIQHRWRAERAHRLQPGSWHVEVVRASQLQLGPLALTRAMCPPESLHDQIIKHWNFIRSYIIRDDHLFLSLMADGGIYEFEPIGR